MNTSTNTNQTYDTMKITMRTTPTGFGRHTMAGALLAMALTASAVGFAAMGHADDDTQTRAPIQHLLRRLPPLRRRGSTD
jgi:ATP/maltotriose-dependent transcriptional regulator MalT